MPDGWQRLFPSEITLSPAGARCHRAAQPAGELGTTTRGGLGALPCCCPRTIANSKMFRAVLSPAGRTFGTNCRSQRTRVGCPLCRGRSHRMVPGVVLAPPSPQERCSALTAEPPVSSYLPLPPLSSRSGLLFPIFSVPKCPDSHVSALSTNPRSCQPVRAARALPADDGTLRC